MHATGVLRDGNATTTGPTDARFEIASITKVFTGILLADMALHGEVALDDPLTKHLPSPRPAWRHRPPTLLELATHRSGLANTPRAMRRRELLTATGMSTRDPWAGVSAADYPRLVAAESPRTRPGGRVIRYSSMGMGLLGDALAARAGVPYETLLRDRILDPLDMAATSLSPGGQVPGHTRGGRPAPPLRDHMPAAGSLRSTVDDMLRFLRACLDPPTPAFALAAQPYAGGRMKVGLGWFVVAHPRKPRIVWHNGGTWGFRSFTAFRPSTGEAVVVLSDTAKSVDKLGFTLLES